MPSKDLSTYVDQSMFEAEPIDPDALVAPKVYLLSATGDPLGAIAAASMMYEGRVITNLSQITDDERRHYFDETFKTTLKAPLEFMDLHLMVEGITRGHSHQEVRQRTAVFAQESMRFAVKETIDARPGPLIQHDAKAKAIWQASIDDTHAKYMALIAAGIPAEEARGILPHDTLTRMHHKVNLRNLSDEIGKRLCTQAQFEWRHWATSLRQALRSYKGIITGYGMRVEGGVGVPMNEETTAWQFQYIADSPLFAPICFATGKCMFKSDVDRGCTIRERVDAGEFDKIEVQEWLTDPTAAWQR